MSFIKGLIEIIGIIIRPTKREAFVYIEK